MVCATTIRPTMDVRIVPYSAKFASSSIFVVGHF